MLLLLHGFHLHIPFQRSSPVGVYSEIPHPVLVLAPNILFDSWYFRVHTSSLTSFVSILSLYVPLVCITNVTNIGVFDSYINKQSLS